MTDFRTVIQAIETACDDAGFDYTQAASNIGGPVEVALNGWGAYNPEKLRGEQIEIIREMVPGLDKASDDVVWDGICGFVIKHNAAMIADNVAVKNWKAEHNF